jgi:hypothetical protein
VYHPGKEIDDKKPISFADTHTIKKIVKGTRMK